VKNITFNIETGTVISISGGDGGWLEEERGVQSKLLLEKKLEKNCFGSARSTGILPVLILLKNCDIYLYIVVKK